MTKSGTLIQGKNIEKILFESDKIGEKPFSGKIFHESYTEGKRQVYMELQTGLHGTYWQYELIAVWIMNIQQGLFWIVRQACFNCNILLDNEQRLCFTFCSHHGGLKIAFWCVFPILQIWLLLLDQVEQNFALTNTFSCPSNWKSKHVFEVNIYFCFHKSPWCNDNYITIDIQLYKKVKHSIYQASFICKLY